MDLTGAISEADEQDLVRSTRTEHEAERLTRGRARRGGCVEQASTRPRETAGVVARVHRVRRDEGYALVAVTGEIDIVSRRELAEALDTAADSGVAAVIVDLTAVTLLSAAGFHCLQRAADPLEGRGGCLHVICPPGSLSERLLVLFDLDGRWPRHPDAAAAIAAATDPTR